MKTQNSKLKTQNNKLKRKSVGVIKLYTRSGDRGVSGLSGGERVSKGEAIFEVLGTIDELNSWVGMCVVEVGKNQIPNIKYQKGIKNQKSKIKSKFKVKNDNYGELIEELMEIQEMLLTIGAVMAGTRQRFEIEMDKGVEVLEKRIDWYQDHTGKEWYKRFLLPGGVELAARLDVARTVCRRAERVFVSYKLQATSHKKEKGVVGRYLNRLSDYLFAARCYVNWMEGYREKEFGDGK